MENEVERNKIKRLPVSDKAEELRDRLRQVPLVDRLSEIPTRISKMCSQGRPPTMSIPVRWDDDDWFITYTVNDALEALRASSPSPLTAEQARRAMKRIRTEVDGLSDKDMKGFEDEIERGAAIITSQLMTVTPSPTDETLRLLLRQLMEIAPIFANQKCPLCSWGGSDTHRSDCPFVLAKEVAAAYSSSIQSTARKIAERIYDDIADLFAMPVDRVACVASIEAKISAELTASEESGSKHLGES